MAESQDKPNLADRVNLTATQNGEQLISLFGTGRQVFQRVLQVLSGQQDVSGVTVGLDKTVQLGGVIIDATRAPFRVNGRKWSFAFNLAAPGATSNIVRAMSRVPGQPKNGLILATVEEIRYQGPSVCSIRPVWAPNISDVDPGPVRDLEAEIIKEANIAEKPVVPALTAQATTGGVGTGTAVAFLANVAAGNPPDIYRPDGLVLWPGEWLELIQQTQNVVMTVTISGKVWTFSQRPA